MKITYSDTPQAPTKQEAQAGDLIELPTGVIALVLAASEGQILLINYSSGDDWMEMSPNKRGTGGGYFSYFESGDYKILARAGDWHITVDRRAN